MAERVGKSPRDVCEELSSFLQLGSDTKDAFWQRVANYLDSDGPLKYAKVRDYKEEEQKLKKFFPSFERIRTRPVALPMVAVLVPINLAILYLFDRT